MIAIEPIIQTSVDKLCVTISTYTHDEGIVELHTAYMALTLDVVSHYAFGKPFGLVDTPGFSPEWKKALGATIEAGVMNRSFPWLADLMITLPEWVAASISAPVAFFLRTQRVSGFRL